MAAPAQFDELVAVMDRLRQPDGCPWDREQTWKTLRQYVIEEAFEVVEALDSGDPAQVVDECGDLLFQVVFLAQIAKEEGQFDVYDAIGHIQDKLIRRHPHVFSDVVAETSEEVLANWEQIKEKERQGKSERKTLEGVPKGLPALLAASKLGEKAGRAGFDWRSVQGVLDKVEEEMAELREAIEEQDDEGIVEEMGDVLFALSSLGRFLGTSAEDAARIAGQRFEERFYRMEAGVKAEGKLLSDLTDEELEKKWRAAKNG